MNIITLLLISILVGLYSQDSLDLIDCENNSLSQLFLHAFIHADIGHLLVNLYSLYNLSSLEERYGSKNYLILIVILTILTIVVQYIIIQMNVAGWLPFSTCSVGFSHIILALVVYSSIIQGTNIVEQVFRILFLLIVPFIKNPRVSITGHLSGILAGIILGTLTKSQTTTTIQDII